MAKLRVLADGESGKIKRIPHTQQRFARNKNYAIGALQANSSPSDIPARFSQHPVKALHLSGGDLVSGVCGQRGTFCNQRIVILDIDVTVAHI